MEKRYFAIELRADDGEQPRLSGYAAVFDQLSAVLYGQFREKIDRGAFVDSLAGDVRALWNHNADYPLGRTKAGTLSLNEDAHGLRVEIEPPQTTWGRDAVESVRRGDVDQMSFAFDVLDDKWDRDADGQLVRTLRRVQLYEVSPVVFPAYQGTSIQARGGDAVLGDRPDIPELPRAADAGNDAESAQARTAARRRRLALHNIL